MNPLLVNTLNRYPFVIPRLYNYLRLLVMPLSTIADYVPPSGRILDIGCGYGLLDLYLARLSAHRQIIGSELNAQRVRVASHLGEDLPNLKFVQGDLLHRQDPDPFDCVLLIDLLHHVPYSRQQQLIQSIATLLKPGGLLLVKDLDTQPAFKYYWNLVHDKLVTQFDRLYFSSHQSLATLIQQQGFAVEHQPLPHPFYAHHLFICRKS